MAELLSPRGTGRGMLAIGGWVSTTTIGHPAVPRPPKPFAVAERGADGARRNRVTRRVWRSAQDAKSGGYARRAALDIYGLLAI